MPKINSKNKGSRVELEVVKILEKRFGKGKFRKVPSSGALVGGKNKEMSENLDISQKDTLASDIICPPNFSFSVEVKGRKEASFWDLFNKKAELNDWLNQVYEDAEFANKKPLLIVKYNRKPMIAYVLTFTTFNTYTSKCIFLYKSWSCCLLDDLLKEPDEFWMRQ